MDFSKLYVEMCEAAQEIQDIYFEVDDFRPMLPSFLYDRRMDRFVVHIWMPIIRMSS